MPRIIRSSVLFNRSTYQECPNAPYQKFSSTGDNPRSFLDELSSVVQSGITTLVWARDADWICNWMGNLAAANAVEFGSQSAFRSAQLKAYNVNGKQGGTFKTVDNFSFLRVFAAGHEVPYYRKCKLKYQELHTLLTFPRAGPCAAGVQASPTRQGYLVHLSKQQRIRGYGNMERLLRSALYSDSIQSFPSPSLLSRLRKPCCIEFALARTDDRSWIPR